MYTIENPSLPRQCKAIQSYRSNVSYLLTTLQLENKDVILLGLYVTEHQYFLRETDVQAAQLRALFPKILVLFDGCVKSFDNIQELRIEAF